jgi:Domain of unknown function (DUF1840)
MLVRFSSIKTESIIMFGEVAVQLIKLLGASGDVPGAIHAEDIPNAVTRLRNALQAHTAEAPVPAAPSEVNDDDDRSSIDIAIRAAPLIDLLQRAAAAHAPVMWEAD